MRDSLKINFILRQNKSCSDFFSCRIHLYPLCDPSHFSDQRLRLACLQPFPFIYVPFTLWKQSDSHCVQADLPRCWLRGLNHICWVFISVNIILCSLFPLSLQCRGSLSSRPLLCNISELLVRNWYSAGVFAAFCDQSHVGVGISSL